jgi:hypothetical protein
MADSQELEPSTSKANPYNAGRQNHQEIEKRIISKLKLESTVTRVREYSADRTCIRNIKTDLIAVST